MKRNIAFRILATGLVALAAVLAAHGQPAGRARLFPRELLINNARVVIHAPQVESWKDHETVIAWHAMEVTFLAEGVPHVGAVKIRAVTHVDKQARTVHVYQVEVLEIHFLGVSEGQTELLSGAAKSALQAGRGVFPLDLVLAHLATQKERAGRRPLPRTLR